MKAHPCLPLALALIIGLVLGDHLPSELPAWGTWGLIFFLITLPIAIFLFPSLSLLAGCGFLLAAGISQMTFFSPRANLPQVPSFLLDHQSHHLAGLVIQEPLFYPNRTRLVLALSSRMDQGKKEALSGRMLLSLKGQIRDFNLGDPIRFVSPVRRIEGFRNPGGYDFPKRMSRQGIYASGYIEDPSLILVSGPSQVAWPWQKIGVLRKKVIDRINTHFSPPSNGLAQALLTGDQSQLSPEVRKAFNQAGVAHLLAFSGLNLGLVAWLAYYLLRFLLSLSERLLLFINIRKWALIGSFIPVLGYALIAGLGPSVARALFMVSLVILALMLNRYSDLLNSLALAAIVLLLVSPEAVFMPSFQLSFLSVWAIGYLLPRIWYPPGFSEGEKPLWSRRFLIYLWVSFCVSLVTQLATFPVVLWWFHQVSLVGLISNLILVPLTGILITPLGLLALIFSPLYPQLSSWIFGIISPLLDWTLTLTGFFAGLPFSQVTLPRPGFIEMGFFYVSLLILFNWRKIPRPLVLFPTSLVIILLAFYSPQLRQLFGSPISITFLDVGHGSAIVIQLPKGEKVLIDGGGSMNPEFDLGERVVAPFLWQQKISALDVVVVTHPHPDHLNGIPYVLSNFKVGEVWVNGQKGEGEGQQLFEEVVRRNRIPVIRKVAGWKRHFPGADLEVLHPSQDWSSSLQPGNWHGRNDTSLVLRLTCKDQAILLPGDIEADGEACLLASGRPLKSQLLQVPHHGSISSSQPAFIQAVAPVYAVISGRRGPRLPIPHEAVIQRYRDQGIILYRTDMEGAVTFSLKGNRWEVESHLRGRLQPPG